MRAWGPGLHRLCSL